MNHVFISYKHQDATFASKLARQLEDAGFSIWMDEQVRAGENWRESINDAIKAAFAMIVVMTPESKHSEYVTYEWAYALGAGIKVVPVMLRHTLLHPQLDTLQYLDFTDPDYPPWTRLVQRVQELQTAHTHDKVHVDRGAPAAVKQAVSMMDSVDPKERDTAVTTLAQMTHPAAIEALAAAASHHPMRDIRMKAAFGLARATDHRDPRAVPGLVDALLHHDDSELRLDAAIHLEEIAHPSAIEGLTRALADNSIGVRQRKAAARALERIGTPEALEVVGRWRRG